MLGLALNARLNVDSCRCYLFSAHDGKGVVQIPSLSCLLHSVVSNLAKREKLSTSYYGTTIAVLVEVEVRAYYRF